VAANPDRVTALRYQEHLSEVPGNASGIARDVGKYLPVTHRCEEALADLNRAVELDPGNPGHFAGRGRTYQEMERYEEALADFNRAVELDPGNPGHFVVRGEAYRLMERYEEALADLNRAVGLDPSDAWAIAIRGVTYRELGVTRRRSPISTGPSNSAPATPGPLPSAA
jgi:tetratricopeptide (TPR) repeat protein